MLSAVAAPIVHWYPSLDDPLKRVSADPLKRVSADPIPRVGVPHARSTAATYWYSLQHGVDLLRVILMHIDNSEVLEYVLECESTSPDSVPAGRNAIRCGLERVVNR